MDLASIFILMNIMIIIGNLKDSKCSLQLHTMITASKEHLIGNIGNGLEPIDFNSQ